MTGLYVHRQQKRLTLFLHYTTKERVEALGTIAVCFVQSKCIFLWEKTGETEAVIINSGVDYVSNHKPPCVYKRGGGQTNKPDYHVLQCLGMSCGRIAKRREKERKERLDWMF